MPADPIIVPANLVPELGRGRKKNVFWFAGAGGAGEAAKLAGLKVDAALNHWSVAIGVHQANNAGCDHFMSGVWETPCTEVLPGEPIGLGWFSPDCRHFSIAKGAAPVSARVRGLAWVVIHWAKLRRPDVIMMENVQEWLTWGPLIVRADGMLGSDPARKGQTAALFFQRLRQCGYRVEHRVSMAADFGDPTLRKRLLVIAVREDLGVDPVWPAPTHAPRDKAAARGLLAHVPAADIIDFSRPCHSIFLTKAEARAVGVKRPLEPATHRRIARGLFRYSIAAADPFIVPVTHAGDDRTHSVRDALRTMTTSPRGEFALVAPSLVRTDHTSDGHLRGLADVREATKTAASGGGQAMVAAQLVGLAHGDFADRPGLRVRDPRDPMNVIHAQGGNLGLVAAHLHQMNTRDVGGDLADAARTSTGHAHHALATAVLTGCGGRLGQTEPVDPHNAYPTVTAKNDSALAVAWMEQANTDMVGHDLRDGVSTIVGKGCTQRLVVGQLSQLRGSNAGKGEIDGPLPGLTGGAGHQALLTAHVDSYYGSGSVGAPADGPFRTTTALARHSLIVSQLSDVEAHGRRPQVLAFLREHFGEPTGADHADPLASPETRARFGIVLVPANDGPPTVCFITDIGMRMLDPETELAAAMGFRPDFKWTGPDGRKVTKTQITKLVGNAVCRQWAAAHIRANCSHLIPPPLEQREAA